MAFSSEELLNILAFDTHQRKILTLQERCLIHKERARQIHGLTASDFKSESLQQRVKKTLLEMKQTGWTRCEYQYWEESGKIKLYKI